MSKIELKDADGHMKTFVGQQGIYVHEGMLAKIKPAGDLKTHLKNVRNLDIRPDDIFIATFPKSGTHWMWEIVHMLVSGAADYSRERKEAMMLEFLTVEETEQLASPRILNCHWPLHLIPTGVLDKNCKIIHVWRNFKDVLVSFRGHMAAMAKARGMPASSLSEIIDLFTGKHGFYMPYPWFRYVAEWQQLARERPDQVLNLSFEELKKDSTKEVKKVAQFLGKECSDELAAEIAEKCSFKNLKKANQDVKVGREKNELGNMDFMYRKGEVGDWKNWFTVAQNEWIDSWLQENLKDTDLDVTYTL